jgi:uncharacterized membrane protein
VKELLKELPALVEAGALDAGAAERVRAYYAARAPEAHLPLGMIILGVLGALLIGLGIVLLVAHNWVNWSRNTRTIISFAPVIAGQLLCAWTLLRHNDSVAWREGSTTFLMLGLATCIALIGQTYHIYGDLESFLLVWALLSLPLIYLFRASMVAALYWIAITGWAETAHYPGGQSLYYLALMALAAPHYLQALRADRFGMRAVFLGWTAALTLGAGVGLAQEHAHFDMLNVLYAATFSLFYLADARWFDEPRALWRRPWFALGAGGVAVLSLVFTMDWTWDSRGWWWWGREIFSWQDLVLGYGLLLGAALLWVIALRARQTHRLLFGGLVFAAAAAQAATLRVVPDDWIAGLFNLYVLALALTTLRAGLREQRLAVINGGLVILCALIMLRFFDSDLPYTLRGAAFVGVGVAFLAVNLWVRRRDAAGRVAT